MANASTHPQQSRRAASRKFADGGPVRGPGTGTSDEVADEVPNGTYIMPADSTAAVGEQQLSTMGARGFSPGRDKVPVQLSNGEYKLPPEQVHAIGVQALDQMKDATHAPGGARGFAPAAPGAPQEPEPRLFFSEGGVVDEEQRRRQTSPSNIYPQSSPSAGANVYGGAGFSADQFGSSGQFAKVPDTIGQQPGRQTPAPAAPPPAAPLAAAATAPTRAPAPASPAPTASPVRRSEELTTQLQGLPAPQFQRDLVQRQALEGQIQHAQANERYDSAGAQMAAEARAAATMRMSRAANRPLAAAALPASTGEAALAAHDAGGAGAGRGFVNPPLVSPPASAPTPPAAAASTPPAPSAASATAPAAAPPNSSQPAASEYGPPASAAPPPSTEVMPGIFRSGNSYGDSAQAAIAGAAPRGLPSAGDMAAADALADRSQSESLARVTASRGFTPGFTGVIGQTTGNGNMWSRTPEQQRRDAEVSASSIVSPAQARGLAAMRRVSDMDKERVALAGHEAALQQTRMQGDAQRDVAALREQGDMGRAVMRERGDTGRAVLREQGDTSRANARNDIEAGRLALDQQVRGFDIRNGQRQESLVRRYEAAKTPAEKASIAQQIRDLNGKTSSPREDLMVVGGGQEWDAKANVMRNVPQRVFDARTRQFVDGTGAAPGLPAQDSPEVLAIRNNTSLSLEQRREELRKLGFQ